MPRPAKIWLVSDTHWYHDRICRSDFENRPVDHMDRLLASMRSLIMAQDELIHLGDVIFYKTDALKPALDSVPCRKKILVLGNHDRKSRNWYMNNGFDWAADSVTLGNKILTHMPMPVVPEGFVNVHGHWHSMLDRPNWWSTKTHRLVSLELNGYVPEEL